MSERSIALAQRCRTLRAHCAIQREELAQTADQIEAGLEPVDRGINAVRRLARHPAMIVGGIALLTALGPKRMLRWAGRGVVLFTTGRRVLRLIR